MARLARVVVPGLPHHITQRGNRRQQTFFCDEDHRSYLELMGRWCGAHQVEIRERGVRLSGNTRDLSADPDRSRVGAGLRESLVAVLGLQFRENRVYTRSSSQ